MKILILGFFMFKQLPIYVFTNNSFVIFKELINLQVPTRIFVIEK